MMFVMDGSPALMMPTPQLGWRDTYGQLVAAVISRLSRSRHRCTAGKMVAS